MRLPHGSRGILAAVALAIAIGGCGGGDETDWIALVSVAGTVTHDNKPLEDALVAFVPADSNKDLTPGSDATNAQGSDRATWCRTRPPRHPPTPPTPKTRT